MVVVYLATLSALTIHISFSFYCVKTSSERALFTYLFQSSDTHLETDVKYQLDLNFDLHFAYSKQNVS